MAQLAPLRISTHDAGMTALHRAGLAGLYMSLAALEHVRGRPAGLNWSLSDNAVEIYLARASDLSWLCERSFGIDRDGLLDLVGLRRTLVRRAARLVLHEGFLLTFAQWGRHRRLGKEKLVTFERDEDIRTAAFRPLEQFIHQEAGAKFIAHGKLREHVTVIGWLSPGGGVRHSAFGERTALEEPPSRALALVFAPVGCFYFLVRSPIRGSRVRCALVVPEFASLAEYARARTELGDAGLRELTAAGLGDAALQFMLSLRARNLCSDYDLPRCTVITFGTVGWAKQQKTRTAIAEVDLRGSPSWRNYEVCNRALANRMIQKEDGTYFPAVSPARELIADNIALGRRWYAGFSRLLINKDLRKQISYERKGLNAMVTQARWSEEAERWFVEACHEAWRNRLGEIGARAQQEGADFPALVRREREKLRVGFARCRSSQTVRKEIADFWARAGRLPTVQQHWRDLLSLIEGDDWQRGRDLALLALVSYAGPGEDESTDQGGKA